MNHKEKKCSTSAEINKMIAEKQTLVVEQIAILAAYDQLDREFDAEQELLKAENQRLMERNNYLTTYNEQKQLEIVQYETRAEVFERDIQRINAEITEINERLLNRQQNHTAKMQELAQQLEDMKESILSVQPGYAAYKKRKEENHRLQEEIAQLAAERAEDQRQRVAKQEEDRVKRNNYIVQLVTAVQEWRRCDVLVKEHREASKEYKEVSDELMATIMRCSNEMEADSAIQFTVDANIDTETVDAEALSSHSQQSLKNVAEIKTTELPTAAVPVETFKVPQVPPSLPAPKPKVSVLQNIEVPVPVPVPVSANCAEKRKDDQISSIVASLASKKHKSMDLSSTLQTASAETMFVETPEESSFMHSHDIQSQSEFFAKSVTSPGSDCFDYQNLFAENNTEGDQNEAANTEFMDFTTENETNFNSLFNF